MARASPILTNFTGGEFSPRLAGRVDFRKYFDACKTLQNMIIHPHGGATRRPGTYFVAEVRYPLKFTRLIPFEYSTEQAYILEFGDQYIRVYKNDANDKLGSVVETAKDITDVTQESPVKITSAGHGYSNGDEIYIDDTGVPEIDGRRFIVADKATDYFYLNDKDGNNINGTGYTAYVEGGTCERIYQLTTSPYLEAELPALQFAQSANTMYIAHPNHPPMKLTRTAHTSWTLTEIDYLDGPYLLEETGGITPSGTSGSVTLTSDAALFVTPGATGDINRLFRLKGSTGVWTWCKITAVTDSTHATATIRGAALPNTNKITTFRRGYWSNGNGFPGSVNFFEQRLWWGGNIAYSQVAFGSKIADPENYAQSTEVLDDDPIIYLLESSQVNATTWLATSNVLSIGTWGGVFNASGATTSESITPSSIQIKRKTGRKAALIMPVVIDDAVLYVQRSGLKIREFAYKWEQDDYRAFDLTKLAEHITRGGITGMAYQSEPDSIVWCPRADGIAAAMTYEKDDEVLGWHRHISDGEFESFAVIPATNHDQLSMVVKRTIDEVEKRYVEYMKPADWGDDQEDCFFVDCGLTYDGAPTTTIGGFGHLEGKSLAVLADGATHANCTVVDGIITLNHAASKVHGGLPYTSILETMDLEAGAAEGTSQGKIKRPWKAVVRLYQSGAGCKVGPDVDNLETISSGPYTMDEAPPLFTGLHEVPFPAGWNMEARVMVTQDLPLPLTVLSIMPRVITSDA